MAFFPEAMREEDRSGLPADRYTEWDSELELFVQMRDGVRLSTDVYRPKGAEGRLPTVLTRTPYDKSGEPDLMSKFFLRQGFAVVIQSERGRYFSEGYFGHYLQGARTDGYDTVEWIAQQPWSNGKVGTIGCSSTGEHQWPMASANHPGHAAMIPMASGTAIGDVPGNDTRGAIYRGGIPLLSLWAWWYQDAVPSERFLLPPDSTPEQRRRLRKSYSLRPKAQVRKGESEEQDKKLRHLPSQEVLRELGGAVTNFDQFITWQGPADQRWNEVELLRGEDRPRIPCLHINTWHDIGIGETVRAFKHLQDLGTPNQHLIVAPGPHCSLNRERMSRLSMSELKQWADENDSDLSKLPDISMSKFKFGDYEASDVRYHGDDDGYTALFLDWFDKWLRDAENDVPDLPSVQLLIAGRGWISGPSWPLPEVRMVPYYLAADDGARLRQESGMLTGEAPAEEGAASFVYDPGNPAPSLGGGCCSWAAAVDQRPFEARRDVLVFSTPPLEKALTVAGPVEVVLQVSSSTRDTDFIVKLTDVHPDGKSINLNDDGFRVRYREGFDKTVLMEAGQVYRITLPNMVVGHRFDVGHRIRLDITSGMFPLYERNLNTGGNNFDEMDWVVAENSVHLGGEEPSCLMLPVLDSD